MIDFIFINPPYSYTDMIKNRSEKGNKGFYVNYPHLGLAYLAASLEKNGFSAKIIEASASLLNEDEISGNRIKSVRRTFTLPIIQ